MRIGKCFLIKMVHYDNFRIPSLSIMTYLTFKNNKLCGFRI